jgi:hypothetical protein
VTSDQAKARLKAGRAIPQVGVRALLREIADRDYGSIRAMGRGWKCSPAYLSDVMRGTRHPGPALLRKLGVKRVVTVDYVVA